MAKIATPKIGWDYMAGVRGTIAGAKQAEQQVYHDKLVRAQLERTRDIERERQRKQAEAQDKANEAFYQQTYDTFNKPFADNYSGNKGINTLFENFGNNYKKDYVSIVKDPNLSGEQKVHKQGVMERNAKFVGAAQKHIINFLNNFTEKSVEGDISRAMPPLYQSIGADLVAGQFDAELTWDNDAETVFLKGKTQDGQEINLSVQDIPLHWPGVMKAGTPMEDAIAAARDQWNNDIKEFYKTKDNNLLPSFNEERIKAVLDAQVESYGKDGVKVFAMDTMGWGEQDFNNAVRAYLNTERTEYPFGGEETLYKKMMNRTRADFGEENPEKEGYAEAQKKWENWERTKHSYFPKKTKMTQVEAELAVMEDLTETYVDTMRQVWDTDATLSGIKPFPAQRSQTSDTQQLIRDEAESFNAVVETDINNLWPILGTKGGVAYIDEKTGTPTLKYDQEYQNSPTEEVIIDLNNDEALRNLWLKGVRRELDSSKYDADVLKEWHAQKRAFKANLLNSIKRGTKNRNIFNRGNELISLDSVRLNSVGLPQPGAAPTSRRMED
tara:strand:- start:551 stop:2212 length:1662 start_codon:yes stop_codon:yes gene_type:complete